MRTRNIAVVGVCLSLGVLAAVWGLGRSTGGAEQASSSSSGDERHAGAAADRGADRPGRSRVSVAPSPAAEIPALRARDQRRRDAVAPFGASLLGALDGCLTPGPGPRVPQRLLLHFERAQAASPEHETFKLTGVEPVDQRPGQPSLRGTPVGTCLSALAGRTLEIPAGAGSQESSFQEIIAIPIPLSVAWAPPQPPEFPVR